MTGSIQLPLADQARAALARHEWQGAYDLMAAAAAREALTPEELELFAQAAWWVGRLPEAIAARERAYAALVKSGDPVEAAMLAIKLANDHIVRTANSVAKAWLSRAERHLDGVPEGAVHGWLAVARSFETQLTGDLETGLTEAVRAHEIGARVGDRNLEMMGMSCRGVALLAQGDVVQALALMDEATVAAVGGELDPQTAGGVCCATIEACTSLGDLRRAAEWTEAQDRWCKREGINGYPGMCRLFRAEIKAMRGSWLEAEAEARHASDELGGFLPGAVGVAYYTIGELRLRRGDLDAAEEALLNAHEHGHEPQPALALLRVAQGRVEEAHAAIGRALDEPSFEPAWATPPNSPLARSRLLPARVEIAIAAGELGVARQAADELASLADRFGTEATRARSAAATGSLRLAEGDAPAALAALREAVRLWRSVDAPFELASARLDLARAHDAAGDRERAGLEARAARDAFERLGASLHVARAEDVLGSLGNAAGGPARSTRQRVTRTFVFTDIVESTRLAELIGDEAWDRLIRWHDDTLRRLAAGNGGEEVKAIGDGLFLAFPSVDGALDFAIAAQRRLAEHRQAQGFAPAIRIGVHQAEATRAGLDYIGTGVNAAARIGAAAAGGEVLVSATTMSGARRSPGELGRRTVDLKGLRDAVELVSIDWT